MQIALDWCGDGLRAALAAMVSARVSAPRAAGSQLVCNEQGHSAGSVSRGCVEVAVIEAAGEVMRSGAPALLKYGLSDERAFAVGLACGGRIRVCVESLDRSMPQGMAQALDAAQRESRAVALFTPLDGSTHRLLDAAGLEQLAMTDPVLANAGCVSLRTDRAQVVPYMGRDVLVTPRNPPLRLIVIEAVHISESLCLMAKAAGYAVTVVDPHAAFLRSERFPGVALGNEPTRQSRT